MGDSPGLMDGAGGESDAADPVRERLIEDRPRGGRGSEAAEPVVEETIDESAASDGPRVEPPVFREYVVRRGDQIMTIAQRVYGSTRHWQAIAKANPDVDPQKLRAGQRLRIPEDPENVQGVVVEGGEPETPAIPEPEQVEHIVQNNDSLWKIAASFYGDGTTWRIIRDANRSLVGDNGEKLRPGMTIVIPPAPNQAQ
jgi:nucleoid-associated protein YgaU